jgi:hypothetical protein
LLAGFGLGERTKIILKIKVSAPSEATFLVVGSESPTHTSVDSSKQKVDTCFDATDYHIGRMHPPEPVGREALDGIGAAVRALADEGIKVPHLRSNL